MPGAWSVSSSGMSASRAPEQVRPSPEVTDAECLDPGQEIPVQLIERNTGGERWLHSGGVQCPRCESLCEDCSQQTGESQVTGPEPELELEK